MSPSGSLASSAQPSKASQELCEGLEKGRLSARADKKISKSGVKTKSCWSGKKHMLCNEVEFHIQNIAEGCLKLNASVKTPPKLQVEYNRIQMLEYVQRCCEDWRGCEDGRKTAGESRDERQKRVQSAD
jgi:uncharacterized protein YuzB (UPF0349 family)